MSESQSQHKDRRYYMRLIGAMCSSSVPMSRDQRIDMANLIFFGSNQPDDRERVTSYSDLSVSELDTIRFYLRALQAAVDIYDSQSQSQSYSPASPRDTPWQDVNSMVQKWYDFGLGESDVANVAAHAFHDKKITRPEHLERHEVADMTVVLEILVWYLAYVRHDVDTSDMPTSQHHDDDEGTGSRATARPSDSRTHALVDPPWDTDDDDDEGMDYDDASDDADDASDDEQEANRLLSLLASGQVGTLDDI